MTEPITWCYYPHPDKVYFQHTLENSVISMNFGIDTDLSPLDREMMRAEYGMRFPELSGAQVSSLYSMLYHFAHTLQIGDRIIYPSTRHDRMIHVGQCSGPYRHIPNDPLGCIHQRDVQWLQAFDRNEFSPEALRGITVTLVIFQIRNALFLHELDQLTAPPQA